MSSRYSKYLKSRVFSSKRDYNKAEQAWFEAKFIVPNANKAGIFTPKQAKSLEKAYLHNVRITRARDEQNQSLRYAQKGPRVTIANASPEQLLNAHHAILRRKKLV